ncbi:methyltransferase domain-containing protein [Saccharopolyspora halophila]|uniref:Methyltransferase domain-containing protein n=1 Tax=Saccharopolyspora halophila TaxID=405551 RepID=A0ABN3GIR0_9PSEU
MTTPDAPRSPQPKTTSPGSGALPGGANGSLLSTYRTFLERAVRNPGAVGAVAPSSPALARAMAGVVPRTGSPTVVELGPGTGALSGAIADRLPAAGRHLAIELDDGMVEHLRTRLPWLEVIQGDASELGSLLADAGVDRVDAVVSGLPWSIFPARLQHEILRQVGGALAPGGAFTTFAYTHALGMAGARQFRRRLDVCFDEVLTSHTVWRNVPPARTYVCRRPNLP